MEAFFYENQGTNTYLVYKVEEENDLDSFSLGMVSNNQILGLVPTIFVQIDDQKFIKYNITAKVSVKQFFSGPVNKKRLLGVFTGIVDAMIASEEYMLEADTIMLDLDYIFTDVSTCKTELVCLPVLEHKRVSVDLKSFFKNIMFSTQFDQTESCDYVAKIMNYLNSTPNFSLIDFKETLDSISSEKQFVINKNPIIATNQQSVDTQTAQKSVSTMQNRVVSQPKILSADNQIIEQKSNVGIQKPDSLKITDVSQKNQQEIINANNGSEKNMTMMYLLQHYSKENKAIYDAQQAKKKISENSKPQEISMVGESSDEKPMSKFYLLQHYSKENKAIYDAQQAAKKSKSTSEKTNHKKESIDKPKTSFAIPGQKQPLHSTIASAQESSCIVQPVSKSVCAQNEQNSYAQEQNITQNAPANTVVQSVVAQTSNIGGSSMNFGETVVLNAGMTGDTTVLNTSMLNHVPDTPYLTRVKTNEKVHINKPSYRIGKEKSYVDYFIGDNTAISRSHANILERGGEYYIVDTNSTNHTYVDGQMVPSNQEYPIKSGAKIRLANEDFIFTIE